MKTVTSTEAKNHLGALIGDVAAGNGAVVIEHHGRPRAVIISTEEWATLAEMREELQRLEAWQRLKELAAEGAKRNADLTERQAEAVADELADEAKRRLADRITRR